MDDEDYQDYKEKSEDDEHREEDYRRRYRENQSDNKRPY